MGLKLSQRLKRAVNRALLDRDRFEMEAVDALLSPIATPRKRRTTTRSRRKADGAGRYARRRRPRPSPSHSASGSCAARRGVSRSAPAQSGTRSDFVLQFGQ
jgi:hypothetical protein